RRGTRSRSWPVGPAAREIRDISGVEMHAADLPHAVFLHVFILVNATADTGIHAMAALHAEFANAGQCTQAIGRDMHDRLILEMVEHFPLMQPLWTEDFQELAHARLALVYAAL